MCLAFPGRIISISDDQAVADFDGLQKEVNISLVSTAKTGEYVMVHAGFAIQKMNKIEADEVFKLYEEGRN